ncbi:peptidase M15 [Halobacillus fulvus]|nr:peptidase M15 [Halobacillus fulvus]
MSRVKLQTLIDRSFRNMGAVHEGVKDKVHLLLIKCYEDGINVQISSGYRSNSDQQRLYNQGRTVSGNVVTNAKAGQSVHNYGLAVDYFLTTWDGSKATWTVNDDWRKVAELGKALGFEWGGDWRSFKDYPHLQLTGGLTWRDLKAGRCPFGVLLNKGVTRRGHSGYKTYQLQLALKDAGYELEDDGFFGPTTEKIIRKFQEDAGLKIDGLYGPNSQEALNNYTMVHQLTQEEINVKETGFKDVNPKEYYADSVRKVKEAGIMKGNGKGNFEPEDNITRADVAIVISRALKL